MQFQPNPAFVAELERMLAPRVRVAAETVGTFLQEKLGDDSAPSGPLDYPAKVSGALYDSISSQEVASLQYEVGALNAPPEAFYLEYPAPDGSPYRKFTPNGARPWASRALRDSELHARIMTALRGG